MGLGVGEAGCGCIVSVPEGNCGKAVWSHGASNLDLNLASAFLGLRES